MTDTQLVRNYNYKLIPCVRQHFLVKQEKPFITQYKPYNLRHQNKIAVLNCSDLHFLRLSKEIEKSFYFPCVFWENQPTGFQYKSLLPKLIKVENKQHYKYIDKRQNVKLFDVGNVLYRLYKTKKLSKFQFQKYNRRIKENKPLKFSQEVYELVTSYYKSITKTKKHTNPQYVYNKNKIPVSIGNFNYSCVLKTYVEKLTKSKAYAQEMAKAEFMHKAEKDNTFL